MSTGEPGVAHMDCRKRLIAEPASRIMFGSDDAALYGKHETHDARSVTRLQLQAWTA